MIERILLVVGCLAANLLCQLMLVGMGALITGDQAPNFKNLASEIYWSFCPPSFATNWPSDCLGISTNFQNFLAGVPELPAFVNKHEQTKRDIQNALLCEKRASSRSPNFTTMLRLCLLLINDSFYVLPYSTMLLR